MNLIERFKFLYKNEIIRRYVVINSFDGALTILGIILAEFFAGITQARFILLPGAGAAIAMGVSGMWGAYAAEKSEVIRKISELEKHLLVKIRETELSKKRHRMALIIGIVDGLSPVIVSFLILVPFFLAVFNLITVSLAYYIAFIFVAVILFLLGIFTGLTAKEKILMNGVKMLLAGLVIGIIFFILAKLGLL